MPCENRASPWGTLVADPGRGLFFGNRGNLHDPSGRIVRLWKSRAWVTCLLAFKGRKRRLMQPGRYTELFFLDEAAALAAGHRPCGECRRPALAHFKAMWAAALGPADLAEIDRRLHADRVTPGRTKRTFAARRADLPDGAYVELDGAAWLLHEGRLHRWSPAGYGPTRPFPANESVRVLTPRCTVAVLTAGYSPVLHTSASA